jgi:hypothetical protein
MAIDLAGANIYFAPDTHTAAATWAKFDSGTIKSAAIAQAKAQIKRLLEDPTDLDTDTTTDDDFPRHDAAVYEQALHLLLTGPAAADADQSAPRAVMDPNLGRQQVRTVDRPPPQYAPEALRWLCRHPGMVTLARG